MRLYFQGLLLQYDFIHKRPRKKVLFLVENAWNVYNHRNKGFDIKSTPGYIQYADACKKKIAKTQFYGFPVTFCPRT